MRPDIHRYFAALGLSPGASANDIRVAYRKLIHQWHPDRFAVGSLMQTTAEDQTKEFNEAYEWLYKKRHYRKYLPGAAPAARPVSRPVETADAAPPAEAKPTEAAAPPSAPRPSYARAAAAWARRHRWWIAGSFGAAAAASLVYLLGPPLAARWRSDPPLPAAVMIAVAAPLPQAVKAEAPATGSSSPAPAPAAASEAAIGSARIASARPVLVALPAGKADPSSSVTMARRGEGGAINIAAGGMSALSASGPDVGGSWTRPLPPAETTLRTEMPAAEARAGANRDQRLDEAEAELDTFELGDGPAQVRSVQGPPDEAVVGAFRYGSSIVYFKNGRVSSWISRVPRLRIPRLWSAVVLDDSDAFTIGSTRAEVFEIQGRPDGVFADAYIYGTDVVYFGNDRVVSWIRTDGRLRTRLLPELSFPDGTAARR